VKRVVAGHRSVAMATAWCDVFVLWNFEEWNQSVAMLNFIAGQQQ
jgi:hypothetical protein